VLLLLLLLLLLLRHVLNPASSISTQHIMVSVTRLISHSPL